MKREQKTEDDGHKAGGKTEWQTPLWLFDLLDERFGFQLDAAASHHNALCQDFYGRGFSGLDNPWAAGGWTWVNHPWDRKGTPLWIDKMISESSPTSKGCGIVALLPVVTATRWAVKLLERAAIVATFDRRLAYLDPETGMVGKAPNFESMIVVVPPWPRTEWPYADEWSHVGQGPIVVQIPTAGPLPDRLRPHRKVFGRRALMQWRTEYMKARPGGSGWRGNLHWLPDGGFNDLPAAPCWREPEDRLSSYSFDLEAK